MNNGLVKRETLEQLERIAGFRSGMEEMDELFNIKSFEDLEIRFLRGEGYAATTYKNTVSSVRQFYKWSRGLHPLQVNPEHLDAFFDHVLKKTSLPTAKLRMLQLRNFFRNVEKRVPFWKSPFERIIDERLRNKLLKGGRSGQSDNHLSEKEVRAIIGFARQKEGMRYIRLVATMQLLVNTGLRISEALNVRWCDVEEREGYVALSVTSKGGYRDQVKAPRVVVRDIKRYWRQLDKKPLEDDYLIPTRKFTRQYAATVYTDLMKFSDEVNEAAIVKRKVHLNPHLFRHSYATIALQKGYNLKEVSVMMRHRNVATTDRYLHANPDPSELWRAFAEENEDNAE